MSNKRAKRLMLVSAAGLLAMATGLLGLSWMGSATAQTVNSPCNSYGNFAYSAGGGAAATTNQDCHNEGDADGGVDQGGSASSGDGVAGQVAGVVSAGDASVDATNRSDDVDVQTGDATGTNNAALDVSAGVAHASGAGLVYFPCFSLYNIAYNNGDVAATNQDCSNLGDADGGIDQAADAASGDGVGGQVIGVVTSAGGSADLVLDNESTDSDVESGAGDFTNTGLETVDSVSFFAG